MKKIVKICGSVIIAFAFSLIFWVLLLTGFPDPQVQGTAAPAMTKEEAFSLMDYHGVKVIYIQNGEWVFDRDGKTCSLLVQ